MINGPTKNGSNPTKSDKYLIPLWNLGPVQELDFPENRANRSPTMMKLIAAYIHPTCLERGHIWWRHFTLEVSCSYLDSVELLGTAEPMRHAVGVNRRTGMAWYGQRSKQ